MKAGFFFQFPISIELLLDIAKSNDFELVGAFFKNFDNSIGSNPYIYESEDELLVQIDVAFVFFDRSCYLDFTAKTLRRGVNLFLASLPDYTHAALVEVNELSIEIGVPIGFGCAGEILIRQDEVISNYFMLQLIRDAGMAINDDVFRRMLIYDVASFVRIRPCGLRKLRVNSLPLFTKSSKLINLRMEYDNGSVIASSLTRINEPEKCMIRFFSGDDGYFKELPANNLAFKENILKTPELLLNDEGFMASLELYVQEISEKTTLSFGIENAMETLNIVESIEDRLYPMN
ncbi:MAG: hypothetical protein HXX16_03495 [Bacteroidales bacterium]|nr:hypothetical protein [Bacteroidales bacterium]